MTITTYSELQSAVANWVHRADLTTRIPEFIAMAEARLNRELRTREMEDSATGTLAASVALPDDFLEARSLVINYGGTLFRLIPAGINEVRMLANAGVPRWYAISGGSFHVAPTDSTATYTLDYYAKIPALESAVGSTNWLLESHPDAYLYACLAVAAPFCRDVMGSQGWDALYQQALGALKDAESRSRWGTAPTIEVDFA